ncbi:MAG TPA: hypothetical protein VM008_16445 [Phycisphaerae bacterium]|nr:hypothetical protein [Phycisphaerae bacterium]
MGLTIHYDLASPQLRDFSKACRIVEQLRSFAESLQFERCSELITWDTRTDDPGLGHFREYLLCYDKTKDAERFLCVPPLRFAMFGVQQPGSETAFFGLGKYATVAPDISDPTIRRKTGLVGYQWRGFCKTQYATLSSEGGGWENFFKIHDGICRILDHAKQLGMDVTVRDEGNYWDNRDAPALRKEVERWNALIAAFAGKLKDHYGARADEAVVAPITQTPEFERLEAQGQEMIGDFNIEDLGLPEE